MSTLTLPACPNHADSIATHRGVCKNCYDAMAKRVQRGQAKWKDLEAQGLVSPAKPGGRKRRVFLPVHK